MNSTYLKNKYLIYSFFFVYVLFSQVHVFVHLHPQHIENESTLKLCFHPIGEACPIAHEGCEHHHEQHDQDSHTIGDLNHIPAKIKTDVNLFRVFFVLSEPATGNQLQLSGFVANSPISLHPTKVVSLLPARSPPIITL